jgi:hypothetical protein
LTVDYLLYSSNAFFLESHASKLFDLAEVGFSFVLLISINTFFLLPPLLPTYPNLGSN